jgi:hypothetical protein
MSKNDKPRPSAWLQRLAQPADESEDYWKNHTCTYLCSHIRPENRRLLNAIPQRADEGELNSKRGAEAPQSLTVFDTNGNIKQDNNTMNEVDTTPYQPSLERQVHVLACKLLNVPDDDHEFDEEAEPIEQAIMHLIAQHDAAIKGRLLQKMPKEREIPVTTAETAKGEAFDIGFNTAIDQCSAAIEREFGDG